MSVFVNVSVHFRFVTIHTFYAQATAVSLLVGTSVWLFQRYAQPKSPKRARKRGSKSSKSKSRGPSSNQQQDEVDAGGDWTAVELAGYAACCKRRDRLKRAHIKRVIVLLELLLAKGTAEAEDELECSLLFRCLVGYSKWRVLLAPPDKRGNLQLLQVVAAEYDRQSAGDSSSDDDAPIVVRTCVSLHSDGHSARAALAALQLRFGLVNHVL